MGEVDRYSYPLGLENIKCDFDAFPKMKGDGFITKSDIALKYALRNSLEQIKNSEIKNKCEIKEEI